MRVISTKEDGSSGLLQRNDIVIIRDTLNRAHIYRSLIIFDVKQARHEDKAGEKINGAVIIRQEVQETRLTAECDTTRG